MRELRILLTEEDFIYLCQKGYVLHNNINQIKISEDNFDKLIEGKIVTINWVKKNRFLKDEQFIVQIALQDIGYNRIAKHLANSPIY